MSRLDYSQRISKAARHFFDAFLMRPLRHDIGTAMRAITWRFRVLHSIRGDYLQGPDFAFLEHMALIAFLVFRHPHLLRVGLQEFRKENRLDRTHSRRVPDPTEFPSELRFRELPQISLGRKTNKIVRSSTSATLRQDCCRPHPADRLNRLHCKIRLRASFRSSF
jgi:hypothetical protein